MKRSAPTSFLAREDDDGKKNTGEKRVCAEFENHTRGFGSKMLHKVGYKVHVIYMYMGSGGWSRF